VEIVNFHVTGIVKARRVTVQEKKSNSTSAKDLPRYYYDLTKAKEELQKSKYWPDIKDNPDKYALDFHWIAEVPAEEKVAILFAQNMEEIGLEVNVVKVPWLSVVKEMTNMSTSPHLVSVFVAAHYPEAGSLLESRYHSKSADTWEQNEWLLNEHSGKDKYQYRKANKRGYYV